MRSPRSRRRRPSFQSLEQRRVMAAYINELMVDPLFGSSNTDQYIELRGEPNSTMEEGTYFAVVADSGIGNINPGVIHGLFDLSGVQFGSNGILLILPFDSDYGLRDGLMDEPLRPNVLQSTANAFDALPGDIYSDLHPISERIDFILGSNSYFFFQSDAPVALGQDIDTNNDGVIDETSPSKDWDVYDSISLHHGTFTGPVSYGQIVYIEDNGSFPNQVTVQPGATVIRSDGFGYAARIGDSTGSAASDWVFGTTLDDGLGEARKHRFENGIFGVPAPRAFTGRVVDNLGESNYFGGVRGVVVEQNSETGAQPVAGVAVLADTNNNGTRDVITYRVEPDSFTVGSELTNVSALATLSVVGADLSPRSLNVQSELEDFFETGGNRVFSQQGIDWFSSTGRLLVNFYRPARNISITAIAGSTFTPTYSRLEAFDATGRSLGFVRSRGLLGTDRQQLRLSFPTDQIAYAVAYSDDNFLNSTPFGMLDSLEFGIAEVVSTTDEQGRYDLRLLPDNPYQIVPLTNPDTVFANEIQPVAIEIENYRNFVLDLEVTVNTPPRIEAATFEIDEQPAIDTAIGTVTATDVNDGQAITFSVADDVSSLVGVNSTSGQLFVKDPEAFDFEAGAVKEFTIIATDSVGGTTERVIRVVVRDVNEAPKVSNGEFVISEESDVEASFGRVDAVDPEDPTAALSYEVIGGTGASAFSVDETTGVLRVKDASLLNFESRNELTLQIRVSETTAVPLSTIASVVVSVVDANDAPVITSDSFTIDESTEVGSEVGRVLITEADAGQSHVYSFLSGDVDQFAIDDQTGVITLLRPLDFERQSSYSVQLLVVDTGTPPKSDSVTLTIDVANVNEPTTLASTVFTVTEDAAVGTLIATLAPVDPEGQTNFTFLSSNPENASSLFGGRVVIDSSTGRLSVAAGANLDADGNQRRLEDRVVIFSGDAAVGEVDVVLEVGNVNEAPVLVAQRFELPQGLPSGRVFAQVRAVDPEGDDVTLEVIGEAASTFDIDAQGRLLVIAGQTVDFGDDGQVTVDIQATDSSGLTSTIQSVVVPGARPQFGVAVPNVSANTGGIIQISLPAAFRSELVTGLNLVSPIGALPQGLRFDPILGRLVGVPAPRLQGTFSFTVEVTQIDGDAEIVKESSFQLTITRSNTPMLNTTTPQDVDGNGIVEPLDALRVINMISRNASNRVADLVNSALYYTDTNGNNEVTALDALLVINAISRQRRALPSGESLAAAYAPEIETNRYQANDDAIDELAAESTLF